MDIIGPVKTVMARGYKYIIIATDLFSKYGEAISVWDFTSQAMLEFVQIHIIYNFRHFRDDHDK